MTPAGRRPGPSTTSAAILGAARTLFAHGGYQGTTMRAIAEQAGVNQALIRHFYGSKQDLFLSAVALPEEAIGAMMTTLERTPRQRLGEQIVAVFVHIWRDPTTSHQVQAFFRAAAGTEEGAKMARDLAEHLLLPRFVATLAIEPSIGAAIVAQLLGFAFLSVIVGAEPLSTASDETVVALLGPTVQAYLDRS
jgi:AcrR family transcriptional regulator